MNEKTKAAVIGGALIGVLSVFPVLGGCCFLWALAGGALAVYLYLKNSTASFTPGDGATLGAMAGVVGALIYVVIGLPLSYMLGTVEQMNQSFAQAGVRLPFSGAVLVLVTMLMVACILVICGTLGGLIGAAIFGKNRPGAAPPPPANYGGMPPPPPPPAGGSGYGAGV